MKKITFILPTKNRVSNLKKFVSHHKKVFRNLNYTFLVVDGSNNNNYKQIKRICDANKFTLLKQKKKGFMNACFESIDKVKTEYCTFLYDDDLLSPEIYKVFNRTLNRKFSMGYGIVRDLYINESYINNKFDKIKISNYQNIQVLLAYFGYNQLKIPFMPVSPICLIFKSKFLKKWKKYLFLFCKKSNFRKNILLKQNIGPDLIIYLLQILDHKTIFLSKPYIAIFNGHKNSMSTLLGKNKLQIGYWLAKKSIFDNSLIKNKTARLKIYNFLYLSGSYILIKNMFLKFFKKDNFFKDICNEMEDLKRHKSAEFSLFECIKVILNKFLIRLKYYD